MKREIELFMDVYCWDCGAPLPDGTDAIIFQDSQGHDLRPGYYCDDCAEKYDINGHLAEDYV